MCGSGDCVLILVVLIVAGAVHIGLIRLAPQLRLVKPNFLSKPILGSYGPAMFLDAAVLIWIGKTAGLIQGADAALYLSVMGGTCVFGLIDDMFGSRDVGGFAGHFRKLVFERKLTTGVVKAAGGAGIGIAAGWAVSGGYPGRWANAALVIPLAANVLNLVDLRQGRALAVFFAALGVTCVMALGRLHSPWTVAAIAVAAAAWGTADCRGRAMMGDAGSNMLGGALGLTIALSLSLYEQIGAVLVFAAVNWYSEKHSISALIEKHRLLRAIDGRLGVR